jgi:hypothetical protein
MIMICRMLTSDEILFYLYALSVGGFKTREERETRITISMMIAIIEWFRTNLLTHQLMTLITVTIILIMMILIITVILS